jgi:hypothetical protein
MSVDMDFLFPLDERGSPLPESSSLHWPHLETIAIDGVAEYTPSGMDSPLMLLIPAL